MALCSKFNKSEKLGQYSTFNTVLNMTRTNMNTESIECMKAKGILFYCENCTKHLKQSRYEGTPIKCRSQTQPMLDIQQYDNTL